VALQDGLSEWIVEGQEVQEGGCESLIIENNDADSLDLAGENGSINRWEDSQEAREDAEYVCHAERYV
jgi:hypothetical protein